MKVFITKYALTKGVETAEAESTHISSMIRVRAKYGDDYYHSKDWHLLLKEAIARAEIMRASKLASLEKSAAKIRAMDFTKLKEGK